MMKKYMKFNFIGLIFLVLALGSCSKFETASQDVSPIVPPNDSYPLVKLTLNSPDTITEGDTILCSVSLNRPIESDLTFTPVVDTVLSTVKEGKDFDFVGDITIKAYDTVAHFKVVTYQNITPDPVRKLTFNVVDNIVGEKYLINPKTVFNKVSVSIKNFVSKNLTMNFLWAKGINLGGTIYNTSNNVDFDFYIATATGFDITNPWPNTYGIYDAATGNYPEVLTITPGELPDGNYVIFADLYSNNFYGYGLTDSIPVKTWTYRAGTDFNYHVLQNPDDVINASTPGYKQDTIPVDAVVLKLAISGTIFTVSDYSGKVIGSTGKSAYANNTVNSTVINEVSRQVSVGILRPRKSTSSRGVRLLKSSRK